MLPASLGCEPLKVRIIGGSNWSWGLNACAFRWSLELWFLLRLGLFIADCWVRTGWLPSFLKCWNKGSSWPNLCVFIGIACIWILLLSLERDLRLFRVYSLLYLHLPFLIKLKDRWTPCSGITIFSNYTCWSVLSLFFTLAELLFRLRTRLYSCAVSNFLFGIPSCDKVCSPVSIIPLPRFLVVSMILRVVPSLEGNCSLLLLRLVLPDPASKLADSCSTRVNVVCL